MAAKKIGFIRAKRKSTAGTGPHPSASAKVHPCTDQYGLNDAHSVKPAARTAAQRASHAAAPGR